MCSLMPEAALDRKHRSKSFFIWLHCIMLTTGHSQSGSPHHSGHWCCPVCCLLTTGESRPMASDIGDPGPRPWPRAPGPGLPATQRPNPRVRLRHQVRRHRAICKIQAGFWKDTYKIISVLKMQSVVLFVGVFSTSAAQPSSETYTREMGDTILCNM